MQNRYFGDVGDFGKYGLLRWVASTFEYKDSIKLGMLWYLYSDETHNSDGRHVSYLSDANYRKVDPELFDFLQNCVFSGQRYVKIIENAGILPESTSYIRKRVEPQHPRITDPDTRTKLRERWFIRVKDNLSNCNLIFLDPDNGIAPMSATKRSLNAGKFVFLDELNQLTTRDRSIILYHHTNRTKKVADQILEKKHELGKCIPGNYKVYSLVFRRGSCRVFWLILNPAHERKLMGEPFYAFLKKWNGLFYLE